MPRLESYRFGRLVVNGEVQTRTLIVLLERVVTDWMLADTDSSWTTSKMSASASRSIGRKDRGSYGGCTPIRLCSMAAVRRRRSIGRGSRCRSYVMTSWGEYC